VSEELAGRVIGFFARDTSLVLWDAVDILLVAGVLYYVLLLMRGTRAMQIGIGMLFVFVAYQAAKRLGLVTLYAMLDTLLTSIVLIVVVIFRDEIRRALMRFGRSSLFTSSSPRGTTHVIEEVVKAATALAQKRIGALVVFERDASLEDRIEPGTPLDAEISKELLFGIFVPSYENPLHDGAIVIRDGRVQQAGAFLPLTSAGALDRSLGTRHRAALGLSDETDAVVVVVSEERGATSLCFNGNIVRDLDATALRTALTGLLVKRPRRKDRAGETTRARPSVASEPRASAAQTDAAAPQAAGEGDPDAATEQATPPRGSE
jgi:uncharacterized protein (TIGR00159 family)